MINTQKGTSVEGDLIRDEVLDSAKNLLTPTGMMGGQKGAQQFFTPPQIVQIVKDLWASRSGSWFDPTAGNGALLEACTDETHRFGVEIDGDQINHANEDILKPYEDGKQGAYKARSPRHYQAIKGDIQQVFPLIEQVCNKFGFVVANPPFGLRWSDPTVEGGKEMNSAVLTFHYLRRLLAEDGEWFFLCGADQFEREIRPMAEKFGLYCSVRMDDLGTNVGFEHPATFAFGVHPHAANEDRDNQHKDAPLAMADLLGPWVQGLRQSAGFLPRYAGGRDWGGELERQWHAANAEYKRRIAKKKEEKQGEETLHEISLWGGDRVQVNLDAFTRMVLTQQGHVTDVADCHNVNVNHFILHERSWHLLLALAAQDVLSLDPKLVEKVEPIIEAARKDAVPLYNLQPAQRLGFLTDLDQIECVKSDPERGFEAGKWYPLKTGTATLKVPEQRPHTVRSGPRAGEIEIRDYEVSYSVMKVTIGHHTFTDSQRADDQFDIAWAIEHFKIRDPGNVEDRYPEEIAAAKASMDWVEETYLKPRGFSFKSFQREDVSRLIWKGKGLLAHEQGLGKTLEGIAWALALIHEGRSAEQVLITCPLDLIPQWKREAHKFFGLELTVIDGTGYGVKRGPLKPDGPPRVLRKCIQAQAQDISKKLGNHGTGWFITHYEGLTTNGTSLSDQEGVVVVYEKEEQKQVKGTGVYGSYGLVPHPNEPDRMIKVFLEACPPGTEEAGYGYIHDEFFISMKEVTSQTVCPSCRSDYRNGWNGKTCEATLPDGTLCGYVHFKHRVRPAASYLSQAFSRGCLILDEATYIQGDTAKRSLALRGINARHTLLMTGTPIKNYIRQAFWLLWKSLGNGSVAFPYDYDGGYEKFESHFAVWETYRVGRGNKSTKAARPEITNLSKFWRLLSPSCIRRRKEDTGEPIVTRKFHIVKVALGTSQRSQLNGWLKFFPDWFLAAHPDSPITSRAMAELMAPMIGLQQKIDWISTMPEGDTQGIEWLNDNKATDITPSNYTPSNLRVLELAMALSKQGRKVLIGCNLMVAGRWYADRLNEKGVKAQHILDESDSTMNAAARARVVHDFQANDTQVLCAGIKAIRLGHNLDAGSAVIINGLEWDFESYDQFVARVHRLTSKRPVDVYVIIPKGSITEKKWKALGLKSQSSSLALDGRLVEQHEEQVSESKVLHEMMERGVPVVGDEIAESDIEDAWTRWPQAANWEIPQGLLNDEDVEIIDFAPDEAAPVEEVHPWHIWCSVFPNLNGHPDPIAIPETTGPINKHEKGIYFGGVMVGWIPPPDPEPYTEPPTEDDDDYDENDEPPADPYEQPFDPEDDWEVQLTIC